MIKKLFAVSAFAMCCAGAAQAGVIYSFSYSNALGNTAGSIQGSITLDFLTGSSDSGIGAASDLRITSTPAGIPASVEGADLTSWATQVQNRFEVVNGIIIDYEFGASEGSPSQGTDNVLCLNNGAGFNFPSGSAYLCGANENWFGDASKQVYNVGGIEAVRFEQVSSVPTPATLALVLVGAAAAWIAGGRRRRLCMTEAAAR